MKFKRILILLVFAFVVYYVLRSPESAGNAFKAGGEFAVAGIKTAADALAKFLDTLFA